MTVRRLGTVHRFPRLDHTGPVSDMTDVSRRATSAPERATTGVVVCLGDVVDDLVVRIAGPIRSGTDTAARIERRRGGSAAGVAAAVVASGGRARFVGNAGAGPVADGLVAGLVAAGVEVAAQRSGRPATIVVLVHDDGERTMLTDRGAATELDALPDGWDDGAAALHLPAYSLVGGATAATARRAWDDFEGTRSLSTAGTGLIADLGADAFRTLVAGLAPDVVVANRDEAATIGLTADDPPAPLTVVTRGADPAVVLTGGERHEVPPCPLAPGTDTTGAGDAFAGGLLAALVAGADPLTATAAGHERAAATLRERQR